LITKKDQISNDFFKFLVTKTLDSDVSGSVPAYGSGFNDFRPTTLLVIVKKANKCTNTDAQYT